MSVGKTEHVWRFLALLIALSMAGCAERVVPAGPDVPLSVDADTVVAILRERDQAVHRLRVLFDADLRSPQQNRSASGVLLVDKPDRFRLRLFSPFGISVFDYIADGVRRQMTLPMEGKIYRDTEIDRHAAFSPHTLRQAFLRDLDSAGCRTSTEENSVILRCKESRGAKDRTYTISRQTADLEWEQIEGANIRYEDFRIEQGIRLPYRIEIQEPRSELFIRVRRYEVNPDLSDDLFSIPDVIK